ncbi:hypothetical protein D3C71_1607660 [compost metagenome]
MVLGGVAAQEHELHGPEVAFVRHGELQRVPIEAGHAGQVTDEQAQMTERQLRRRDDV